MFARSGASTLPEPSSWSTRLRFGRELDGSLLCAASLLIMLGLLMVTSASMPLGQHSRGDEFYFLYRQLAALAVALAVSLALLRIPIATWDRLAPLLLLAALILLVLVLIPGIGRVVNGSARWLRFGSVSLQASELAKLGVLIYTASYVYRYNEALRTSFAAMLRLVLVLGLVSGLLLLEPDFGATVVLGATVLGVMFLAGIKIGRLVLLQSVVLLGLTGLIFSSEYRLKRLSSFVNPWHDDLKYNDGFQLTQALIAIGRGEFTGVGLGASIQKHHYLPEAHTDFIFAIIAEELGLIGVVLVMGLYALLVWRAFVIAQRAEAKNFRFGAYLAYGLGLLIALQCLINIGVNTGLLPTKGLTLPLLSFGGSSLLATCIALALLLRIGWETRLGQERPNKARPDKARPDKARPDKARPDKARPDKARPDKARPDKARPDKARPDKAQPEIGTAS